ncbi:MAG: discoidin domain-containing protein [Verrucomicrobiaceae bacterium]|jgi:hypothetical protein|nr:discoidin domain-containing protein [Verrucomicrobiaceae bacterium]
MKKIIIALTALAAVSAGAATLKLVVPPAQLSGTPVPIVLPNLDQYKGPQAEITVPDGVTNIAKGKAVTSSDDFPMIGELPLITDGNKDGAEGCYVELMEGVQWVQIDLGAAKDIYAVAMWHFHSQERAYKDVIVQVSDDPKFASGVKTIYNNDHDNSAKLGKGDKKAYIETNYGKLVDVSKTPVKGRYVRLYSNGSTTNGSNHYIEVEVFGK